ncbi:fibroblast growth factor receptor substrate 2 [Onthophagus taurus]|uniref:fibroblast growth factor receptor substrate 2 n=1 Tax=Onthophagus taurus TaxID=166361 RepID=UPI000C1FE075|nr:fibroblast growth factor receptor substrate 2 [Onthophagus taurus]
MGCVSSRTDINDLHPNVFQVINVDEHGHVISPGRLEITETELVLHQKKKQPTRWPLKCLRKYGFDSEVFSFECGRRCPTGAGIYAFQCRRAEFLFNMVQQSIQSRNLNDDNHINLINDFSNPLPVTTTVIQQRRLSSSQPEGYLNPTPAPSVRSHPSLSRPGSITSNGPISPPVISPLSVDERNNNKRDSLVFEQHSYTNNPIIEETPAYININPTNVTENYVNLPNNITSNLIIQSTETNHLYMNITCDNPEATPILINNTKEFSLEEMHCYANIDPNDLESLKSSTVLVDSHHQSVPATPTSLNSSPAFKEVNYAELDLVPSKDNAPDSPSTVQKSYVTIDFNKTTALSQSVNPRIEIEEGSRKTRHNSTINDVMPTRHSNSLSD